MTFANGVPAEMKKHPHHSNHIKWYWRFIDPPSHSWLHWVRAS